MTIPQREGKECVNERIFKKKGIQITLKWLQEKSACSSGVEWYKKQKTTDLRKLFERAQEDGVLNYINWAVTRKMTKPQRVEYAIFAAEQVIHLYDKKYPKDQRPRQAIEAAKAYLKDPSEKNRNAAADAYAAADAAAIAAAIATDAAATVAAYADAAYAAAAAADAAATVAADADAADAAAIAAAAATVAADAAYAATVAAYADAAYAAAARKTLQILVIENGLKILEKGESK